jgi:hypothetical protein
MLSLLLACKAGSILVASSDSPTGADSSPSLPEDDSEPVEDIPDDTAKEDSEVLEGWPKDCADLYDQELLPTFNLEFSDAAWNDMQSDCRNWEHNWHPVTLHYEDETVEASVRLKGNWSWSCDKFQFMVSFNETDSDGRFHGLRKLVFDAPWYDRTFLHERLAFTVFKDRGLPYSCVNNARVEVNGELYGFYANIERIDREYLERHFEEPDGNLYQGGTELKTNEDVGDISRLEALQDARTVEEIDALVDLDQAVAEWSVEAMIPAMDNYWAGVEINYYLYDHPSQGFIYLPYDLDISFGDAAYTDGTLVWPDAAWVDPISYEHTGWGKEELVKRVLADSYWCERFVEELALSRDAYDPMAMSALVDSWEEQIADSVAGDERKPFSTGDHGRAVEDLKEFLTVRREFVSQWLEEGGHCPEP